MREGTFGEGGGEEDVPDGVGFEPHLHVLVDVEVCHGACDGQEGGDEPLVEGMQSFLNLSTVTVLYISRMTVKGAFDLYCLLS